jgi:hypothetical protein
VLCPGGLRIRNPLDPAAHHAVDLARAVLTPRLGWVYHLRKPRRRHPAIEFDGRYTVIQAVEEVLRYTTHVETEEGLAMLW